LFELLCEEFLVGLVGLGLYDLCLSCSFKWRMFRVFCDVPGHLEPIRVRVIVRG